MGQMFRSICPHCGTMISFPEQYAGVAIDGGHIRDCTRCGKLFVAPDTEVGNKSPIVARVPNEMECAAYLEARAGLDKPPSWFAGIVIPLLIMIGAIWYGFIQQDIHFSWGSRPGSPGEWLTGQAAVWGGVDAICVAAVLHASMFWARIPRFRTAAFWGALAGIVGFLVAGLMVALAV